MTYNVTRLSQAFNVALLGVVLCATAGCSSAHADDDVSVGFIWGPVQGDISEPQTNFRAPEDQSTRAARLREDLLSPPVNRYAPSDKDWRYVRGDDKGPLFFGVRLSFSYGGADDETQLRFGAVKRGANRTYGPQVVFRFDND